MISKNYFMTDRNFLEPDAGSRRTPYAGEWEKKQKLIFPPPSVSSERWRLERGRAGVVGCVGACGWQQSVENRDYGCGIIGQ
jgi:hypothetical protein